MKKMIYAFLAVVFVFGVVANAYACPMHDGEGKSEDKKVAAE